MADVLATVNLICRVLAAADLVIGLFDRFQNAPRHIREFRGLIVRLSEDFASLREDDEQEGSIHFSAADQQQINETLELCRTFFEKYKETLTSQGIFGGVRRAFWPLTNGDKLDGYRDRIYKIYNYIVIPVMLRLIRTRQTGSIVSLPGRLSGAVHESAALASRNLVREDSLCISPTEITASTSAILDSQAWLPSDPLGMAPQAGATKSKSTAGTKMPKQELQVMIDQRIRSYRMVLGKPVTEMDLMADNPAGIDDEEFEDVKTVLCLDGGDKALKKHRELQLEELHIVAGDDDTLVFHFRCRDRSIRVKHLVPTKAIPYVTAVSSLEVSFLASHSITVIDQDGPHLYRITDPRYQFETLRARKRFQQLARDKKLLGEFEAADISVGGRRLAVAEVLQLWRQPGPRPAATMTFRGIPAAGGRSVVGGSGAHVEWHIEDFQSSLDVAKTGKKARVVRLCALYQQPNLGAGVSIRFSNENDVPKFKRLFESHYPEGSTVVRELPRLELSPCVSTSSSLTSASATGTLFSNFSWEQIGEPGTAGTDTDSTSISEFMPRV
ncbi:hypothetical protein B0T19DRAFT_35111 [Cercophora scortea]|uniref:Uncharacterized protein n=1 Tax=Cercophora scortea TaxID=314031 RepID=A0AAE0MKY0_9PEZI|nr:hypothetical protein B0T19DRAFT_35111 [Cercophora scortea]